MLFLRISHTDFCLSFLLIYSEAICRVSSLLAAEIYFCTRRAHTGRLQRPAQHTHQGRDESISLASCSVFQTHTISIKTVLLSARTCWMPCASDEPGGRPWCKYVFWSVALRGPVSRRVCARQVRK